MKFGILPLVGLLTLAGCIGDDTEVVQGSTACEVASFEFLLGQDKSAVEGVTLPEMLRVMEENSPATMDFHENRLNVIHDASGKILQVSCG